MNMISRPIEADDMRSAVASVMDCTGAPDERARRMAATLHGMLERGEFHRLNGQQLVCLRGLVWGLTALADDVEDERQQRQRQRPVRWWRR